MKNYIYIFIIVFAAFSCKKNDLFPNKEPETSLYLDKIDLSGPDRLNSIVTLKWSGEDQDGIISHFLYSFDGNTWNSTTRTDSTFKFDVLPGSDSLDVDFYIKAVDNQGLQDPTPSYLKIPLKNTTPTIAFDESFYQYDSVNSVVTLKWAASDLDGNETLDSIYIKVNNGNWVALKSNTTLASFVSITPKNNGTSNALIYLETQSTFISTQLPDFKVNDFNTFYIKVKDNGGLTSLEDTSKAFFVKQQLGDLLVIDNASILPRASNVYLPALTQVYGNYDYIDFTNVNNVPKLLNPTLSLIFSLHKEVIWYSGNSIAQLDYIDRSESVIQNHLNAGKKLFMAVQIPRTVSSSSSIFRFSPIDSLTKEKDAFFPSTGELKSDMNASNFPTLKNTGPGIVTAVNPFYPKVGSKIIYRANLTKGANAWLDSTIVMAGTTNISGKTNQVFSIIPLEKANGNLNLIDFFTALKNEFNW